MGDRDSSLMARALADCGARVAVLDGPAPPEVGEVWHVYRGLVRVARYWPVGSE